MSLTSWQQNARSDSEFAQLLVGSGKGVLEVTVVVSELITSPLLRLDMWATDFLTADIYYVALE
jgi:hypothetical protein